MGTPSSIPLHSDAAPFAVVQGAPPNHAAAPLAPEHPQRSWRELLRANALIIGMLLLVIFFALKVSRRVPPSANPSSVADSGITKLASPEELVVFADEPPRTKGSRGTNEQNASPSSSAKAITNEAAAVLMPPESTMAHSSAKPSSSNLNESAPARSFGPPSQTVSSMLTAGTEPVTAADAEDKPEQSGPIFTGLDASSGNLPDLPPQTAASQMNADAPSTAHQESNTPRGIMNWEKYLPSPPEAE